MLEENYADRAFAFAKFLTQWGPRFPIVFRNFSINRGLESRIGMRFAECVLVLSRLVLSRFDDAAL